MKALAKLLPLASAILAAAWLAVSMIPPRDREDDMQVHEFSRLPSIHQGRVKPVDTLARNALMVISGRQTYVDAEGASRPAIRWLLDVMTGSIRDDDPARKLKVFRIENDQVLAAAGLEARPGLRYALDEFSGKAQELQRLAVKAHDKPAGDRDLFDDKVIELAEKLHLYFQLSQISVPHLVPPRGPGGAWRTLQEAAAAPGALEDPDLRSFGKMLSAYAAGNAVTFNSELAAYRGRLAESRAAERRSSAFEAFFNSFAPFYRCSVLYVVIFLLVCCSFLGAGAPLRSSAVAVAGLTLALHTFALVARMVIQDRIGVFVTNLYSSAIFIGWGGAVLGLVLERFHRNGIGTLMGAVMGFLTLLVAHSLAAKGDTLEVMQAVLDTNFWLATHVTAVTIGYAATFMAGGLGIVYIVRGLSGRSFDRDAQLGIGRMIYGIVCFATFFSFTGTVLGGIWADQSWGRFWGWDPKENGALIIVLWNALILHARWGGMIRTRGIAVLAVLGNIVTAWSWFGVNMLGVGLHSYGFMGSAVMWLAGFVLSQLLIAGLAALPAKAWSGGAGDGPVSAPPAPAPAAGSSPGAP